MADFKKIEQESGAASIYSEQQAGKKVFLEAETDAFLFKVYWFSEMADRISFEAASEGKRGDKGGGCKAVEQRVTSHNELHSSEKAVGIVDRDSLLETNPELFYETDDDVFYQHNFVDNIYTLNRWEIENYGLDLENIQQSVKAKTFNNTVASSAFESLEQAMVLHTCASTFATIKATKAKFNPQETDVTEIRERLKHSFSISDDELAKEQQKITAFDNNETSFEERWNRLARLLDGKKVIEQLDQFYKNQLSGEVKKKFAITGRDLLAKVVEPPQELVDFIDQKVLGA